MKKRLSLIGPVFLLLVALALVVPVVITLAQDEAPTDGEYTLFDEQIDSGSGEMSDGEYEVYGTAGIPYISEEPMTDGEYTMTDAVTTPQPPGNAFIRLKAVDFEFGSGWKGVLKQPIADMYIAVFDEDSCVEVANYGSWGWKGDLRKQYFDNILQNCEPISEGVTEIDGEVTIDVYNVPGQHVVIAFFEKQIGDDLYQLYLAKRVQVDELDSTVDVKLGVMTYTSRFNSKKRVLPLMGTTVYGSELVLYEPEYIVWEEGQLQEDFPFISVSEETWDIETSLYPPEGYEPDATSKSTYVDGSTETTVFEVTEVGSTMDFTRIEHDIKELKNGKVVQRVQLKHGIGTKSHGRPERFGRNIEKAGEKPTPGEKPETIKLREMFTGGDPKGKVE